MQDLPEAVQKTVKRETAHGKLRGLAKEVENGQTFYEAETTVNGTSRDILIDANGAVVEVEEATSLAKLPEAAQKAINAEARTGKLLSVEKVTKGAAITYEAAIQKGGKKTELAVGADGTRLK
jgi:hypothetical protein